jgi:hypothetical protein
MTNSASLPDSVEVHAQAISRRIMPSAIGAVAGDSL